MPKSVAVPAHVSRWGPPQTLIREASGGSAKLADGWQISSILDRRGESDDENGNKNDNDAIADHRHRPLQQSLVDPALAVPYIEDSFYGGDGRAEEDGGTTGTITRSSGLNRTGAIPAWHDDRAEA